MFFSHFAMTLYFTDFGVSSMWECLLLTISVVFFFFLQQTCRVSELDVFETVNDDRLVQNGDPYLFGDTIYTCVDGRWVNRGMCSHTC